MTRIARSASTMRWFYDHPPFYQRMLDAEREIMFLPKKSGLIETSPEFKAMQTEIAAFNEKEKKAVGPEPELMAPEQGCPAPDKPEYKPGEPIENLCALPASLSPKAAKK